MVVFHCKGISLVLGASNQVVGKELGDEGNGPKDLHKEEEVQEVRLVGEAEGLDECLVAQHEAETKEHDDHVDAAHDSMLDNMHVNDVTKFVVDNCTDFINRMLSNERVKKHNFTPATES